MRIAAISDLHIGAHARTDSFGHAQDAFLRLLDGLEATHDKIVLLGDIYQTDHGWLPGLSAAARMLERARERVEALTRRWSESQYLWVHGNHDPVTAAVLGAHTEIVLGEPGARVLFTHGDAFDPTMLKIPRLSVLGTWFAGRTRGLGLMRLAEYLEDKDVSIKAGIHLGDDGPYASAASGLMEARDVNVVVMGHTHVPLRQEVGGGVHANTGTCSRGRFMGVSVDTGTGEVRNFSASSLVRSLAPRG